MDCAASSIKTWLKFFMDASIPAGVATEYAISFSDNRMRLDMLPDLNKDYLRDLNITVLGDVIAILKHAKSVSHQEYKARKIGPGGGVSPSPSPPPPPVVKKAVPSASSESPASRMVKRLVRKEPGPPPTGPAASLKRSGHSLQDGCDADEGPTSAKRRLMASGRLGTPQSKPAAAGGKKTVFDRLGSESQVSSTTPDSTTRFKITGLSGPAPAQRSPLYSDPPAVTARQRVTFVSEQRPPPARGPGLTYRGVLKPGAAATAAAEKPETTSAKRKPARVTSTLASDREAAAAVAGARSRIGLRAAARSRAAAGAPPRVTARATAAPAGVRARLSRPAGAAAGAAGGVKARLGGGGAGSVLSRLGTAAR